MIQKVAGYLICLKDNITQVLVIDHVDFPEAGRQIPGGKIEQYETAEEAVLRKFEEQPGLDGLQIIRQLAGYTFNHPAKQEQQYKTVFLLKSITDLPDEWLHVVQSQGEENGLTFRCYWVNINEADLIDDQGDFLKDINEVDTTFL